MIFLAGNYSNNNNNNTNNNIYCFLAVVTEPARLGPWPSANTAFETEEERRRMEQQKEEGCCYGCCTSNDVSDPVDDSFWDICFALLVYTMDSLFIYLYE